ncbi:protein NRT1/ PTR FAMILY 2.11-like isoform X2 [Olea europaea var. sylvestris]|uniref:protein NRT1/ PTR FAMILY 2.11-like isoform X2 n=1 Tax=Olea europaea var. sylvestris TaxID=158386 RepID=UPI000C1CCF5F|nr:protein NRT1/ PTR FAMILY 2.11-like isoform X2 [Olea europaea var. sylvestris]
MEKNEVAVTKKEPNYRGIRAMPFVIGNETFEKLGTIGTSSNMLVYLSTVFNMSSISATNFINILNGTCNFGTMFGAFLSDTYLGRYKTLGIASISSNLGMLVLTLTAAFPSLHPPKCGAEESNRCVSATPWQLAFLFSAFGLLVVGASGIRPCNLAFGADQFNPNTDSGRKGINSFFNWYYFTYTFAMMISLTLIVYVQTTVSWAIGLGIPAFLMFLSVAFFFIGSRIYVKVLPEGSPLTSMAQTLVVAFKKRKLKLPEQDWSNLLNYFPPDSINSKLAYSDQLRFLNKAAIITPDDKINTDGSAANPWCLCSIQQVEAMKCVIRVIPIWVSGIIYYVIIAQMQTYVIFQAIQSNRYLGSGKFRIPAASYTVFNMLSFSIWIPIYDRLILPLLRRITRNEEGISLLQRIGIGMVLAIVTMLVSALVENHRRTLALTRPTLGLEPRKGAISSMSGYWLIPQLAIAGISESFTVIGLIEFYYKQFPENMRSFAGSFVFCASAMSSYLSSFLISVVHRTTRVGESENWLSDDLNKGRLDYFYYQVAGLEVLNLVYFLICSKYYKYKTRESNIKDVAMEEL